MSITAKDLAKELGLSPAAVSVALNGKPGVSDETRQRVLDAAAERGYDMTRITKRQKRNRELYFLVYKKHGAVVTDTAFFSELFEGVHDGCREAGEEPASCLFADNDLIAIGAMKAFKEKGYRIPEDICISGFDNIPYAAVVEPGLTTVHVPKQEMGRTAVRRMVQILEQGESVPLKIEISTRLIRRKSA